MPTRPQQQQQHLRQPPLKQLPQMREDGGIGGDHDDSQASSPFSCGTSSWSLRASASAMAAVNDSPDDGGGAEMTSTGGSDDGDDSGGNGRVAALLNSKNSQQRQRQSCRHSRVSPCVKSTRKAAGSDPVCISSLESGLGRAAAAAVLSTTSLVRPLQAPVTSTSAVAKDRVAYYSPPSSNLRPANACISAAGSPRDTCASRILSDSKGIEAGTLSNKSNHSGGGSVGAFAIHDSVDGDAWRTEDCCTPETALRLDGEGGTGAHTSPPSPATAAANTMPLTYAAVASSLHGKRLPQSRIGFSQWRKRVCCGSASLPSTIGSTSTTPGITSATTANTTVAESTAHASLEDSLKNRVPSISPSLTIPSVVTTANPSRATDKSTPTSSPYLGGDGEASFPNSDEHFSTNEGPQHPSATLMMPPLPQSVHRHQPTHLILQLPNAPLSQQQHNGPDSDSEEEEEDRGEEDRGEEDRGEEDITHPDFPCTAVAPRAAATASELSSSAKLPAKSRCAVTESAAPSLLLPVSEGTPVTRVRTPGAPMAAQQLLRIQRPLITPSPMAFTPIASAAARVAASKGMHRAASTAPSFNAAQILPGLFLGSYAEATDTATLAEHGVSLVINCAFDCPVTSVMANNNHHVRYVQFPLRDHSDEVIAPFFAPVTRIIHDQLHRRQVHQQCMARRTAASAPSADANNTEEHQAQDCMLWAWTDEGENVWAVPPSPVTPSMSVDGQQSFENRRETPPTPPSLPGLGERLGEGVECRRTTTSFSVPALSSSPLTIVDPRDCGGVLVCCRMGVSRSATFIIAYLILYGCTLAPLDDTASLFASFLERERRIIEEAGGVTSFTDDDSGGVPTTTSTATAISGRGSGSTNRPALAFPSLSLPQSPPSSASANTPFASRGSPKANGSQSFLQRHFSTNSPWIRRRSSTIPVSSPLSFGGNCSGGGYAAGPLTTPLSGNPSAMSQQQQQRLRMASPPTPIEFASRMCQPCYLMHLRERRLQQAAQRRMLISGQPQQRLREQSDEEHQMRRHMPARELGKEYGRRGDIADGSNFGGSSSTTTINSCDDLRPEEQQYHYSRCVVSVLPSSAPVASHRSARGSCRMTLLEAAYADERTQDEDGVDEEMTPPQQKSEAMWAPRRGGARMANEQRLENRSAGSATTTPRVASTATQHRNAFSTRKVCVAAEEAAATTLGSSAVASMRRGHSKNVYGTPLLPGEQQHVLSRCSYAPHSLQTPMNGSIHGDLNTSMNTLLGFSFASSDGGSPGALGSVPPVMTYRDAFDAVKRQKPDVNPNIGFVLALRELASGGDFSFSMSF
ncbi:putative Dual specificity phosphatase, catalytic domain containing protein [Leishmania shawi]|uniref:Dual specificity phosphatase, catalytic domain containing protein n=1 Tax=Leishmania shawi TaxID=5680 RepID=A0AAW3BQV5_9TRYP